MLKRFLLFTVSIFILSGCAANYMIAPERKPDLNARTNKATLVVIRDTSLGFAIVFQHYLDGKFIGETKGKTYFITYVDPGPHYVMISTENTAFAHFNFKRGKTYYLREGVIMGIWRARTNGFGPLSPQEAEQSMKDCTYWEYDPSKKGEDMDAKLYQQSIKDYQEDVKQKPEGYRELINYDGYFLRKSK